MCVSTTTAMRLPNNILDFLLLTLLALVTPFTPLLLLMQIQSYSNYYRTSSHSNVNETKMKLECLLSLPNDSAEGMVA